MQRIQIKVIRVNLSILVQLQCLQLSLAVFFLPYPLLLNLDLSYDSFSCVFQHEPIKFFTKGIWLLAFTGSP